MQRKNGFTLTELLIVVAILALLTLGAIVSLTQNRLKADDAKTKSDLNKLKIVFEDYFGDHNCYPPTTYFDDISDCNSNQLSPYLNVLLCNKKTGLPYTYTTDGTSCPQWFKVYGTISDVNDEKYKLFLDTNSNTLGTYAVSSSNLSMYESSGSTSQIVSPPPSNFYYYCSGIGNCTSFDPTIRLCTPYYLNDGNCGGTATQHCFSVGSCL